MLNLALDTSTQWGRFALAEDGHLLAYRPVNVSGSYADALLPVVAELLTEAGREVEAIEGVGIACGPGSFTGVRIGVATAKGLAFGLRTRLVAVPTLAAMAAALLADAPEREWAVPALDARRGEVFAAVYRRTEGWVEEVLAPAARSPDAWWQRIREKFGNLEEPLWGGDGLGLLLGDGAKLRPDFRRVGHPVVRLWSASHPATAQALALAMGDPAANLPEVHPFLLTPLYLRPSDAEVKRKVDLTPEHPGTDIRFNSGKVIDGKQPGGPA